jgi:GNAT superfamily N-acetyltransferase
VSFRLEHGRVAHATSLTHDIRRLEELTLNAWPSLRQVVHDGWILRFSDGYTGRSNSVQPLYEGALGLDDKIRFCEQQYSRLGMSTLFKLTDAAQPRELDAALESRGYRAFRLTSVQVAELDGPTDELPAHVSASDRPTESWVTSFASFRSLPEGHVRALRAILANIALPAEFVTASEAGEVVACGMGVAEPPWVGLFDIGTRLDRRRRGHAMAVVRSILRWARGVGATRAYLQVMLDNTPATSLYAKLGFAEAYRYWYRSKRV